METLIEQAAVIAAANPGNTVEVVNGNIVETVKVSPVIQSGINNTVEDEAVRKYCDLIIAGKPTGKCFHDRLSNLTFTSDQRLSIRAARAEHRLNCMNNKKAIVAALRNHKTQVIGSKSNKDNSRGAIRWANEALKPLRESEIFGANPKIRNQSATV